MVSINPLGAVAVPYALPVENWFAIRATADRPIDVYVVDADGRAEYLRGGTCNSFFVGATNRRNTALVAWLPAGVLYLLLANRAKDRAMAEYELRAARCVVHRTACCE